MTAERGTRSCPDIRWMKCPDCNCDRCDCQTCEGTGLKFPGLSQDCWRRKVASWCDGPYENTGNRYRPKRCAACGGVYQRRHKDYSARSHSKEECPCQGRGRVPVDTLEAWLDAVRSFPNLDEYSLSWSPFEEGDTEDPYEIALWLDGEKYAPMGAGYGNSFQEAISQALCKNLNQHVETE